MQKERSFWTDWAHFLHQWGLTELAAALLETGGPFNVLLAQALYARRPLLSQSDAGERLTALASMMEDQEESRSFAAYVREESSG